MKVIINFGEKKVVVPCGIDGDISIREVINSAITKYSKLSYNSGIILNSDQVQLRLNNGAVVDPDDRVCDVVDDREELFAIIDSYQPNYPSYTTTINSNGELSSSITSSNLSSSLSEHDRLIIPSTNTRHEVLVTDADLRTRSLRVKNDPNFNSQQSISQHNKMTHRQTYSPPTKLPLSDSITGMYNITIDEKTGDKIFSIILPKENSPLGIHVIPFNGDEEHVNGLVLQNIEDDGRIKRQGILEINDRIIEINRTNIEQCSFDKAQLIFRTALLEPELELKIIRTLKRKSTSFRLNDNQKTRSTLAEINQNNDLSFADNDSNMNSLNTRRLGKIIKISLIKGHDGLGFKLASRDNPTGIANPIYVKTIFPKGAAIEDGRLQRGDRLLTVNSIDVTQMSLQDTVGLLRETRVNDTVELCISRQRDGSVPHDFINDAVDNSTKETKPQLMTFDIPLNDTSSAGLGITLKGKTSIIDGQSIDLGIFVKSILTGGAASRDNRLRPNDQLLVINDSSLINLSNLEAAAILHEAVRREIQPGHIKVTISRLPVTIDERNSTRYVKEIDLSSPNNDENELDLTTFVPPPVTRKPPFQQSARQYSTKTEQSFDEIDNSNVNPFERETAFRQSVSEKRRLTHQPNKQAVQWKQRSFHESRTQNERKSYPMSTALSIQILTPVIDISDDDDDDDNDDSDDQTDDHCRYSVTRGEEQPMRALPDSSSSNNNPGLIRSSSFESIHTTTEGRRSPNVDEERKRQAKLRSRACNDSFRQAVDKSYCQTNEDDEINEKLNKSDKQKFRFSNLFNTKSKRKENQEEKSNKSIIIQHQHQPQTYYPPPPPPFSTSSKISYSSSPSNEQQGYHPYRFDSTNQQNSDTRYESQNEYNYPIKHIPGKSSLSINHPKTPHLPIPRQFFQTNIHGSQSLRQHQINSHPSILPPPPPSMNHIQYPSTFTVQPSHFTSYSHNFDNPINTSQQTRRIGYTAAPVYPTSRNYFHLESPANV